MSSYYKYKMEMNVQFLNYLCNAYDFHCGLHGVVSCDFGVFVQYEMFNKIKRGKKEMSKCNGYLETRESDIHCASILRMDRRTYGMLCDMIRDFGGLKPTRNMSLE